MFMDFTTSFKIMIETRENDGLGGTSITLQDGETFKGALALVTPKFQTVGGLETVVPVYKFYTKKAIILEENTIIKDVETNRLYQVELTSVLRRTPNISTMDLSVSQVVPYLQTL